MTVLFVHSIVGPPNSLSWISLLFQIAIIEVVEITSESVEQRLFFVNRINGQFQVVAWQCRDDVFQHYRVALIGDEKSFAVGFCDWLR